MYVLRTLVERRREATLARAVRAADRPEQAHRLIADGLGPLADAFGPAELERARQWYVAQPAPPSSRVDVTGHDLRAALGVFLLVFASTFPVVLPYLFIADLQTAKRLSVVIAIAMLYVCGHGWGRYAGASPRRTGLYMVLMGVVIEGVVLLLGG
jgi:VIT1/CCC1 family predicted Fe2+/Mn2+ transporter